MSFKQVKQPPGGLCADQVQTKRRSTAHEAQTKRRSTRGHAASASVVETNSSRGSLSEGIRKGQKAQIHGNPIVKVKQGK